MKKGRGEGGVGRVARIQFGRKSRDTNELRQLQR
jgi:hypothetical protein